MSTSSSELKLPRNRYLVIQLLILAILYFVYYLIGVDNPLIFSPATYLVITLGMQLLFTINFRKGFSFYKKEQFENAIPEFQKSYDFYSKHRWLDNNRYIIMMSATQNTYLEMSLVDLAYSYEQLGNAEQAKELYLKTLSLFPESEMAKTALNIMNMMKKANNK